MNIFKQKNYIIYNDNIECYLTVNVVLNCVLYQESSLSSCNKTIERCTWSLQAHPHSSGFGQTACGKEAKMANGCANHAYNVGQKQGPC